MIEGNSSIYSVLTTVKSLAQAANRREMITVNALYSQYISSRKTALGESAVLDAAATQQSV